MTENNIYIALEKKWIELNKIKIGDNVKILRISKSHENGWAMPWGKPMNDTKNKTLKIKGLSNPNGYGILLSNRFFYPYFVLEPVTVRKPTVKMRKVSICSSSRTFKHGELTVIISESGTISFVDGVKLNKTNAKEFVETLTHFLKTDLLHIGFSNPYQDNNTLLTKDEASQIVNAYKKLVK